jgi:N-acetylmuramoyl-L-alanine amidase
MKLMAALAVAVMLLMGQSNQPAAHSVTAVRHWSLGDVTRVAIEVSGPFEFRSDRLHNPERVYFDVLNALPNFDNKRLYTETVTDKLLQRIRVAETNPGITRVVLELTVNAETSTSTLTNPHRLIIELRMPAAIPTAIVAPHVSPPVQNPPVSLPVAVKPLPPVVRTSGKTDAPHSDLAVPGLGPESGKAEDAGGDPVVQHLAPAPALDEFAQAARHTSAGTSSLIRALGLKINRVVIDPGHGGHDQGTEGPKGLLEKDLVLDVALRVGKLVQDHMNAEVIYTRTDDTFIPLEGRTALANVKKADLFLSIHANSSPVPRIAGVETYYLNINGSREAMDVAARENGATQRSIFDLQDIIRKITLHDKSEESHELATRVQSSLYSLSLKNFPGFKDRGVKSAPFVVLVGANMPSVLAEIGFVSNSKEEALLKKPEYRQKLAEALYKGMEKYTEGLSHFQAAVKP